MHMFPIANFAFHTQSSVLVHSRTEAFAILDTYMTKFWTKYCLCDEKTKKLVMSCLLWFLIVFVYIYVCIYVCVYVYMYTYVCMWGPYVRLANSQICNLLEIKIIIITFKPSQQTTLLLSLCLWWPPDFVPQIFPNIVTFSILLLLIACP